MKQETSCSCLFDDYGIKKYTKIGPHHSYVFLKICNNFENSFPSTKQLGTAASSFPQKGWWYLMKRIVVRENIREPVIYATFLSDGSTTNLLLWKILRAKIKVCTFFFYNQLNFSSQPQVAKRCYLRLKVANFWLSFATTYILLDVKTTSSVYRVVRFTNKFLCFLKDTFCQYFFYPINLIVVYLLHEN